MRQDGRIPLHFVASSSKAAELEGFVVNVAGSDREAVDAHGHNVAYYKGHRNEIGIPKWDPRPIPAPLPPSPKKAPGSPLKAGAGAERAAMSQKAKREEREARESTYLN